MKNKNRQNILIKNRLNYIFLFNNNNPQWNYFRNFYNIYSLDQFLLSFNKFTINYFIKYIFNQNIFLKKRKIIKNILNLMFGLLLLLRKIYLLKFNKKKIKQKLNIIKLQYILHYKNIQKKKKNLLKSIFLKKYYSFAPRFLLDFFFLKKNLIKTRINYQLHWYFISHFQKNLYFAYYKHFFYYKKKNNQIKQLKILKKNLIRKAKMIYLLFINIKYLFQKYFKDLLKFQIKIIMHNYFYTIKKRKILMKIHKKLYLRPKILNVIYTKLFLYNLNYLISFFTLNISHSLNIFLAQHFSKIGKSKKKGHSKILKELQSVLIVLKLLSYNLAGIKLFIFGKFNSKTKTQKREIQIACPMKTQILKQKIKHNLMFANTFTGTFGFHLWYYQY
jgi:hypothetical protein